MCEIFERDGILVGWQGSARNAKGEAVPVFIPRREEDVDADRALIAGALRKAARQ